MNNKNQNFLDAIISSKRKELSKKKNSKINSDFIEYKNFGKSKFLKVFEFSNNSKMGLIAEIKFASPTSKNLGSPDELIKRVIEYEKAGATAVSIITEKQFFKGDTSFVPLVKKQISIPVLQKDFVIDESQIYEAKKIGSDALLLIAKLVDKNTLKGFVSLCLDLGIEPVVEITDAEDLGKAIATDTNIIAVNARNLETFVVDVDCACRLLRRIPDKFITLGFSGILSNSEVNKYRAAGAQGVLVGTNLMKAKDSKTFIQNLEVTTKNFVKVKICGIQSLEAAKKAIASGADYLGFIFVKDSKRSINVSDAKKIISVVKPYCKIVGVFRNNTVEEVNSLSRTLDFDLVQLHGDESPKFCSQMIRPVIKALSLPADFAVTELVEKMKQYHVQYFLIDRIEPGVGEQVSVAKTAKIAKLFPIFYAGGLTPENVSSAVEKIKPFAVDVITGVKTNDMFDEKKMKKFVDIVKSV